MVQSGLGLRKITATPVLLVEDDHGDAALVQACLDGLGVPSSEIILTSSVTEGMAALERGPRCILLDVGTSDADRYESVHALVEAAPNTPVIVLTGYHERDGAEALAAGAQDYLAKDTLSGELLERSIRYAVERKRAQRAREQLRDARVSAREQVRLERGLLPTPLVRRPGVECSTYYQAGRDHGLLGGDFFDVVELPDGRVRAVIGDVMGHGPDEAALGVHLRVAWRTLVLAGTADADVLPTVARLLDAEQAGTRPYVTLCDLTLEADAATIRLAGHPAPIMCVDGVCTYPDLVIGAPIGVRLPGANSAGWPDNRVPVPPGTSLLLYTDGLLDAYTGEGDSGSLGLVELIDAVQNCIRAGGPAGEWISHLVGNAPRAPVDDTAVVLLAVAASLNPAEERAPNRAPGLS